MTAANGCMLGAELCSGADEIELTEGYSVFAKEAKNVDKNYQANSVNVDGWDATCKAFSTIFSGINVIYCFLHGFIKVRDHCRKLKEFNKICGRVWRVYHAGNKKVFAQRLRRLKEWASDKLSEKGVLKKINSLYDKSAFYQRAYDHPEAYRTSNMVDRLMRQFDISSFVRQYFHGEFNSANKSIRAWALLRNYFPYCLRKIGNDDVLTCAASNLNGFMYSNLNWLENLIVASSMNGYRQ